jgi:hypothetical protein
VLEVATRWNAPDVDTLPTLHASFCACSLTSEINCKGCGTLQVVLASEYFLGAREAVTLYILPGVLRLTAKLAGDTGFPVN